MKHLNADRDLGKLLEEIAKGNRSSFDLLYKETIRRISSFLRKKGNLQGTVEEDLIQEIYLKVWSKAKYFSSNKGKPLSWLLAISQNCLFDYWRRIQSSPDWVLLEESDSEMSPLSSHNEEQKSQQEFLCNRLTLQEAVKNLNKKEVSLFKKVFVEGKTMQQCSTELKEPSGTIKWRVSNLKKKLQQHMV